MVQRTLSLISIEIIDCLIYSDRIDTSPGHGAWIVREDK